MISCDSEIFDNCRLGQSNNPPPRRPSAVSSLTRFGVEQNHARTVLPAAMIAVNLDELFPQVLHSRPVQAASRQTLLLRCSRWNASRTAFTIGSLFICSISGVLQYRDHYPFSLNRILAPVTERQLSESKFYTCDTPSCSFGDLTIHPSWAAWSTTSSCLT